MSHQNSEYDFTLKKFAIAIGLLAAVFLVTTVLYGSIKGFGSQKSGITKGANALNAAFTTPPPAGQFFCRIHGAVGAPYPNSFGYPSCPVCGQPMACTGVVAQPVPLSTVAAG